ncbi:MAG: hypothetical protein ACRCXX_14150 [Cetobacterium sp.]|uniref:hypothetical protein n=1 Tax=Cetobacterium sp. TaxID=2071632 RepID=UPI003F3D87CD
MDKQIDLDNLRKQFQVNNSNILYTVVQFFQKAIQLGMSMENIDKKLMPKLILGEESKEKDSSKTLDYTGPIVSITLERRAPTGINASTMTDLFHNNLIAGTPKFHTETTKDVDGEDYEVQLTSYSTDNELLLTLKTKTVKEQFTLLPIIERSLNIYSQKIKPDCIVVCGVKNIKTEEKKDDTDLETASIHFQLRVVETITVDDTYLLKGFEILTGIKIGEATTSSGGFDETGTWVDNETKEFTEFF